jgi:hypothetical protein
VHENDRLLSDPHATSLPARDVDSDP